MDDMLTARFRTYFTPAGPDECWPWNGAKNGHGYGTFRCGPKKNRGAHVVAWEVANGRPVQTGLLVRHSCDNRPCVNPAHLIEGTHAENMRDRNERGRQARGPAVVANRDPDYARGDRSWARRHPELLKRGSANPRSALTETTAEEAIRRVRAGESQSVVAASLSVSKQTISLLMHRGTWLHVWAAMERSEPNPQD